MSRTNTGSWSWKPQPAASPALRTASSTAPTTAKLARTPTV